MTWIDDHKGAGPSEFNFTEQEDKFGYLNNPNWTKDSRAVEFSEAIGLTVDREDDHKPCGHWHKGPVEMSALLGGAWWQQSLDVFEGKIAVVGQSLDGDAIIAMKYEDKVWTYLGGADVELLYYSNTCRCTSDAVAYYCAGEDANAPSGNFSMRLYVFEDGKLPRRIDVWESNTNGIPYKVDDTRTLNVMDFVGDTISCICNIKEVEGVTLNKAQIKTSTDKGLSFPTTWTFPTARASSSDDIELRISEDGTIWAMYLRTDTSPATSMIELWSSTDDGISFSKVWEKDYYTDLNSRYCFWATLNVSGGTGKYITLVLDGGKSGSTYYHVIYNSVDGGTTFTVNQHWLTTYDFRVFTVQIISASNAQYTMVLARRISDSETVLLRSTDYGATFSEVSVGWDLSFTFSELQSHNNEVVYGECGEDFDGTTFINILYSSDNGADGSWILIPSPIPNQVIGTEDQQVVVVGTPIPEPQVWKI